MNLFFRELKANRRSLIIWCIGMLFTVAGGMAKFSGFSASGQSANEVVSIIPESVRIVLGFGNFDLSTAIGFYGVLFSYIAIMAAIHATTIGSTIIAKEERDKTTEFLLARPISRSKIIAAKLAAATVNILVLNLVIFVSSYLLVDYYSGQVKYTREIVLLMAGLMIIQFIFMLLGSASAAFLKRSKVSVSVASAIMLVSYILDKVIDLNKSLDFMKFLTPFKYFNAGKLLGETGLEPIYTILSAVLITVFLLVTFVYYRKRDMNI